jgi:hypothetical protein
MANTQSSPEPLAAQRDSLTGIDIDLAFLKEILRTILVLILRTPERQLPMEWSLDVNRAILADT